MVRPHIALVALLLACIQPASGHAQIPTAFTNLQALPTDIESDSLVQLMRSFSFATGLQCGDCHVMGEGGSFQGARFDLDEKPAKRKARYMIEMVQRLNESVLPGLPERSAPALAVECKMCHRGLPRPFLLRTELRGVIATEGAEAAVERYRRLREVRMQRGAYDFGEWEMNELARELAEAGDDAAAAAMLELNEEFHPTSASIPRTLAAVYERLGRMEDAVAAYHRAVGRNPRDTRSLERLRTLTGGG